jgi:hypothetical protein
MQEGKHDIHLYLVQTRYIKSGKVHSLQLCTWLLPSSLYVLRIKAYCCKGNHTTKVTFHNQKLFFILLRSIFTQKR